MAKTGIIAGSGFYDIESVRIREHKTIDTPFGSPSDAYHICEFSGVEFAFLARHGSPHRIPPHKVNYRANIWGFREIGVERILSVNAVGSMRAEMNPGDIVIMDQIIDMTHGRPSTFYEGSDVIHIDFTIPYCPETRHFIFSAGKKNGLDLKKSGTYTCVNGPRLETSAEIKFLSDIGGDVVGMTGMPEASLARELELCFASIAIVTNYAAGISARKLTATEVVDAMKGSMQQVRSLLIETITLLPEKRNCECSNALKDAKI